MKLSSKAAALIGVHRSQQSRGSPSFVSCGEAVFHLTPFMLPELERSW